MTVLLEIAYFVFIIVMISVIGYIVFYSIYVFSKDYYRRTNREDAWAEMTINISMGILMFVVSIVSLIVTLAVPVFIFLTAIGIAGLGAYWVISLVI